MILLPGGSVVFMRKSSELNLIIISSIHHPVYKIHGYSKKHIYIFTSPQSKRYVSKVKRKEEKKEKKN